MIPDKSSDYSDPIDPPRSSWSWLLTLVRWLPFVTIALSLLSWVCLELILREPTRGIEGVGKAAWAYLTLLSWISFASAGIASASALFVIDLLRRRRFSRRILSALFFNLLLGPALIYGIHLREYYKNVPPIVRAVHSQDASQLSQILGETEDPAHPSDAANVAITVALVNDDYASIVALVDYFADAPGWTFTIEEALGWLAHDGHQETWERLWNKGMSADAIVRIDLDRLVCRAARYGSAELLEKALQEGGDPNATQGGRTALEWAYWGGGYGSAECADVLHEYGAMPSKTKDRE